MSRQSKLRDRPYRVLFVITRLIVGGAQETVMLLAEGLDKKHFQTEVLCGPQTGTEGSLIEEVRRRGIPLTILPDLVRELDLIKDIKAFWKLYRFMKAGGYDIVHTNSSKAGILGRWAAWLAGTPVIVHTVHGWGHHDYQQRLVQRVFVWLERISAHIAQRLIVVSTRNIEKGLADRIATKEKYFTIRSGIELEAFMRPARDRASMRALLEIPLTAPVVGTVTRLSAQKAPTDFAAAAIEIAQTAPDTHFVMVGDGPLRGEVEGMIVKAGLQKRFHLTGLRRDVADLLTTFDIFVLSSLWEGLPRVLPQAMAAGLPIIASAVDGNTEAVRANENGILVPPGDRAALAEAMSQLLQDRQRAMKMGESGRARVQEFSVQKMVEDHERLYFELMAK